MLALKIIGIILMLVVLILCIRVGCRVEYSSEGLELDFKVACFRLRILPGREKDPGKKKKKSPKKRKEPKKDKPKKKPGELLWLVQFLRPVFRTLGRLRRKLRIDRLKLQYLIAGQNDPATAAIRYGQVSAGGGALLPMLQAVLDVRHWDTDISVDFDAETTAVLVEASADYRIGQLIGIVLVLGKDALIIYFKHQKEEKEKRTEEDKRNGRKAQDQ